jgi:hypothetical protein
VGALTLISIVANLEELMDIRFRDTQSARTSAETLGEVITNYSPLSAMPRSSPPAMPVKHELGLEDPIRRPA